MSKATSGHTKQKTNKSAARRFKVTAGGKVLHRSAFSRHLRSNKSASQLRRHKTFKAVSGKIARRVKRLMALS